jgi:putative component of membrane protein insertase Oxa1/YidC/SpoIIIJ protein YidD
MLASLLIAAIQLYRAVAWRIPRTRDCLFVISCSRHVERIAAERGFWPAMRAMRARFAACRPGYSFEYEGCGWRAMCVDGSVIAAADASNVVRHEAAVCQRVLPPEMNPSPEASLLKMLITQ